MKLYLWLAYRLLTRNGRGLGVTPLLAFLGFVLGIASLVVAMAVISGFEQTLRQAVTDVTGDVIVMRRSLPPDPPAEFLGQVRELVPGVQAGLPFLMVEGVAAHQGQLRGVLIEGVRIEDLDEVLNLRSRSVNREEVLADLDSQSVWIGKGLAANLGLEVGEQLSLVVPIASDLQPNEFRRQLGRFTVQGVLDLGKHEYDERYVIMELGAAQSLARVGDRYHGLILRLGDSHQAREVSDILNRELDATYWSRDWRHVNAALFEAVQHEKRVIFIVLLIIVFAAALNIASTLYIGVVRRFADIAILKTLGASSRQVTGVFASLGLMIGLAGLVGGYLLGGALCSLFMWGQRRFDLIPGEIYQIDGLEVSLQYGDFFWITLVTLLIAVGSTLLPSIRGARMKPVEGLRYE